MPTTDVTETQITPITTLLELSAWNPPVTAVGAWEAGQKLIEVVTGLAPIMGFRVLRISTRAGTRLLFNAVRAEGGATVNLGVHTEDGTLETWTITFHRAERDVLHGLVSGQDLEVAMPMGRNILVVW